MEPRTLKALTWAKRIAYSSEETVMFSYEQAVKYKDSPGVYVECGVATGAQVIAMAAGAPDKIIYAFDSFEGIPLPSNKDDQMPGIRHLNDDERKELPNPGEQVLVSSGATVHSLEVFLDNLENALGEVKNVCAVPGWFEETVQNFDEPISILRLDGDLYNSTYVCLKYLYPKVIKGGLIVVDDWGLPGCRQAVYDYLEGEPTMMQFISNIAYWIK
jgi:O-methyltransferase